MKRHWDGLGLVLSVPLRLFCSINCPRTTVHHSDFRLVYYLVCTGHILCQIIWPQTAVRLRPACRCLTSPRLQGPINYRFIVYTSRLLFIPLLPHQKNPYTLKYRPFISIIFYLVFTFTWFTARICCLTGTCCHWFTKTLLSPSCAVFLGSIRIEF